MEEPRPRRREPLVAPSRLAAPAPAPVDAPALAPPPLRSAGRGLWLGLGVGLGAAVSVGALVFAVAAIPLALFAQIAPDGQDRPEVRNAFIVSGYIGAVVGGLIGIGVGIWAGRGGRLPTDRTPFLQTEDPN